MISRVRETRFDFCGAGVLVETRAQQRSLECRDLASHFRPCVRSRITSPPGRASRTEIFPPAEAAESGCFKVYFSTTSVLFVYVYRRLRLDVAGGAQKWAVFVRA